MSEQLKWYDESADNSPWIEALAELRQRATRERHCYQHVQPWISPTSYAAGLPSTMTCRFPWRSCWRQGVET